MKIIRNIFVLTLLSIISIESSIADEITISSVEHAAVEIKPKIKKERHELKIDQSEITISEVESTVVDLNPNLKKEARELKRVQGEPSKLELRRVDREINKRNFVFKGERLVGATASYLTLSGENADFMLVLNGITADLAMTTVKPYVGYFYRDNRAIGGRFGYSKIRGTVDAATLDLGETNDVEMDVPYVSLSSEKFSYGIFHRAYAALDNAGHFGVFADVELEASSGTSTYSYKVDGEMKSVCSENKYINLSFNPGIAVFVMHNVSATLSFEFGGISYSHIDQYNDAGEFIGSRDASKMRFMFNVLAVSFGINLHMW